MWKRIYYNSDKDFIEFGIQKAIALGFEWKFHYRSIDIEFLCFYLNWDY